MEVIDLDRLSPAECENIKRMMAHVGSKWAPMILSTLSTSPHRFGELKRALTGISQRILTLTLRDMERDGLIARVVTPTIPPKVDYSITDLGSELASTIATLGRWSMAHAKRIDAAHAEFDSRSGA